MPANSPVHPAGSLPPTPCISLCQMNDATGWCDGCLRTIDEIAGWSTLDSVAKRAVWEAIEMRHAHPMAELARRSSGNVP